MKIGHLESHNVPAPAAGERKSTAAAPSAPGTGVEASATVDLSATASLRAEGSGEPSFDQAKVDRIAQALRDGTYKVDARAIADKLIANAEELLGRSST